MTSTDTSATVDDAGPTPVSPDANVDLVAPVSTAADDETPTSIHHAKRTGWRTVAAAGPILAATVAIVGIMAMTRRVGHWWGDDWALYIRQADGLLHGNPSRVAQQNLFTVTESLGQPFSPPIYPWGYPAVLAVAIPVLGSGVDQLSWVNMVAAAVFVPCWYLIAKPRIGRWPAVFGTFAIVLTPQVLSWADLVQSEWVFIAVVMGTLLFLDRLVRTRRLLNTTTPIWILIALGACAEFGFEVRREGLAMVAAIATAQASDLWDRRRELWRLRSAPSGRADLMSLGARALIPYLSFGAIALGIKALLPAVLVPRYEGAGIANVWKYRYKHVIHLADLVGFKNPYRDSPSVLGNVTAGWAVTWLWFALLFVGLILAVTKFRRRDSFLAAYAVVAFIIGCSAKAALSRYFASVTPVATLLVLVAITYLVRRLARPLQQRSRLRPALVAQIVLVLVMTPLIAANLIGAKRRIAYATAERAAGVIQWGPMHPDAIEAFDYVKANTEPDAIIAAFKARSMVLETGRNTVQVDDYRPLNPDLNVSLIVAERISSVALRYNSDPGWKLVWSNDRIAIFAPVTSTDPP